MLKTSRLAINIPFKINIEDLTRGVLTKSKQDDTKPSERIRDEFNLHTLEQGFLAKLPVEEIAGNINRQIDNIATMRVATDNGQGELRSGTVSFSRGGGFMEGQIDIERLDDSHARVQLYFPQAEDIFGIDHPELKFLLDYVIRQDGKLDSKKVKLLNLEAYEASSQRLLDFHMNGFPDGHFDAVNRREVYQDEEVPITELLVTDKIGNETHTYSQSGYKLIAV